MVNRQRNLNFVCVFFCFRPIFRKWNSFHFWHDFCLSCFVSLNKAILFYACPQRLSRVSGRPSRDTVHPVLLADAKWSPSATIAVSRWLFLFFFFTFVCCQSGPSHLKSPFCSAPQHLHLVFGFPKRAAEKQQQSKRKEMAYLLKINGEAKKKKRENANGGAIGHRHESQRGFKRTMTSDLV